MNVLNAHFVCIILFGHQAVVHMRVGICLTVSASVATCVTCHIGKLCKAMTSQVCPKMNEGDCLILDLASSHLK